MIWIILLIILVSLITFKSFFCNITIFEFEMLSVCLGFFVIFFVTLAISPEPKLITGISEITTENGEEMVWIKSGETRIESFPKDELMFTDSVDENSYLITESVFDWKTFFGFSIEYTLMIPENSK